MTQPPQRPPAPHGRRSTAERRGRERRVLFLGLVLSLFLHVIGVVVVGDWLAEAPTTRAARARPLVVEPPRGMRAIEIRLAPTAETGEIVEPERPEPREPETPAPVPEVVVAAEAPADTAADTRTAADRLAPRIVDPRLWKPMILIPRNLTLEDVEARVAAAVELLSDSALAEADAAMRARDWTVADARGGKWGISPGKIHLGDLTLPLPIWIPEDPEARATEAQWYELEQQLERTMIRESFGERVRAIRERRERERAEARGEGGGTGGGG
jgi:hypothetical protein